jgi:cation:H+ antiporter
MDMIDSLILLFAGIFGLWLGTEITIRSAVKLARQLHLSELFIGLVILAFGTDLPELVVAIEGAIHISQGQDVSGIITGNAIGSSIAQISIVIGSTAIFHFLSIGKQQIRYLSIELIGSVVLLALVAFDNVVTWNDGAILIIAFLIYFFTHLQIERRNNAQKESTKDIPKNRTWLAVILVITGLTIVGFSSDYTIEHAMILAENWGVRQSFIGAILIGLGTSLPELAISVAAVIKKKSHLSVGNVIGSNIFDLLIPIGAASMIADINVDWAVLYYDIPVLLFTSTIVLWFLQRKRGLQRWEGIGLIVIYLIYAVIKFML